VGRSSTILKDIFDSLGNDLPLEKSLSRCWNAGESLGGNSLFYNNHGDHLASLRVDWTVRSGSLLRSSVDPKDSCRGKPDGAVAHDFGPRPRCVERCGALRCWTEARGRSKPIIERRFRQRLPIGPSPARDTRCALIRTLIRRPPSSAPIVQALPLDHNGLTRTKATLAFWISDFAFALPVPSKYDLRSFVFAMEIFAFRINVDPRLSQVTRGSELRWMRSDNAP
jgi:hypothetical protein